MSSRSRHGFYPFLGRKRCIGVLVTMALVLGGVVGARPKSLTDQEIEEHLKRLNKPAIKTIISEDGDIVDCVDIYKQPAFDHPLLKNHTIEMRPSFIPKIEKANISLRVPVQQIWQKNGSCPDGTVPIQRIRKNDLIRAGSLESFGMKEEYKNCKVEVNDIFDKYTWKMPNLLKINLRMTSACTFRGYFREVARAELHEDGPYIGAYGSINIWYLQVEANEWSLNSVTLFNVHDSFLETGWAVSRSLFGDDNPRLFVNWMETSSKKGCFNLRCAGFVQVSKRNMLGGSIRPISQYGGEQFVINSVIYKDAVQGKWWMLYQDDPVGYWPSALIEEFEEAPRINWGGSVCNTENKGFHTTTQMGSGHFPVEGFGRASHIRHILVMKTNKLFAAPSNFQYSASYNGCYRVEDAGFLQGIQGPSINYGGPGGKCCDARC